MGSCGSKRRRGGPGPAQDRIDASGSLLDYDYYGGGIANRQSYGLGGSVYGNSGMGIANRQSFLGSTGYGSSCPQGVNQNTALLATAAAIAVGAGVLFRAITLQQAGRRRRRREARLEGGDSTGEFQHRVLDLFQQGLEEFEEKIEALGQQEEENKSETWISNLVKEYAKVKKEAEAEMKEDADEQDEDVELEDLEPPLLDPMWGLNFTTTTRNKRSSEDEEPSANQVQKDTGDKSQCMLGVWRCLSGVLESGVMHIDRPGGLMGMAKKALYKVAFHGGFNNIWSSLMTIPEARSITRCIKKHDRCVAEQIVAEAAEVRGKGRYIINPEIMEEGDSSDGSQQFDES